MKNNEKIIIKITKEEVINLYKFIEGLHDRIIEGAIIMEFDMFMVHAFLLGDVTKEFKKEKKEIYEIEVVNENEKIVYKSIIEESNRIAKKTKEKNGVNNG